jgi:hypothetical protein
MVTTRQINTKVPVELADILDAVVADSPFIGGRSAMIRHGIELALADAVERGVIDNELLSRRVSRFLQKESTDAATVTR